MHSTSAAGVQIDRIFGEPWIKPLAEYIGSFKHEWEHRSQTFAARLGTDPEHTMCDVYLSHPDFYNFYASSFSSSAVLIASFAVLKIRNLRKSVA